MLLRSTTKPPILGVLTKNHISEAFRIDVVNKSMFLRSTTKPPIVSIRGRFDQTSSFMRGVIVPPSKLIVTNICSPKVFFLLGGVNYEGDIIYTYIYIYIYIYTYMHTYSRASENNY